MKKLAILPFLAILILAGCAGRGEAVRLVPSPVPCVTGDLPDEPARVQGELTGDSGRDIGIIAGSAIQLRAWGQSLRAMLEACRAN